MYKPVHASPTSVSQTATLKSWSPERKGHGAAQLQRHEHSEHIETPTKVLNKRVLRDQRKNFLHCVLAESHFGMLQPRPVEGVRTPVVGVLVWECKAIVDGCHLHSLLAIHLL